MIERIGPLVASLVAALVAALTPEGPRGDEPRLIRPEVGSSLSVAPGEAPPPSLVAALDGSPYAGDCVSVQHPLWPFEAERCTYQVGLRSFEVTTATPSADRVARWIVDASPMIPALDGLRSRDRAAWETALGAIARYTMNQSGRAFPVDGVVYEDFEGAEAYDFRGGVTFGTEGGRQRACGDCACRIESLHRTEWCEYVAAGLSGEPSVTYEACLASLGGERGWSDAWASECLALHARAWTSDRNDGTRALLRYVNAHQIGPRFPNADTAKPADVVDSIKSAFAYPHRAKAP